MSNIPHEYTLAPPELMYMHVCTKLLTLLKKIIITLAKQHGLTWPWPTYPLENIPFVYPMKVNTALWFSHIRYNIYPAHIYNMICTAVCPQLYVHKTIWYNVMVNHMLSQFLFMQCCHLTGCWCNTLQEQVITLVIKVWKQAPGSITDHKALSN